MVQYRIPNFRFIGEPPFQREWKKAWRETLDRLPTLRRKLSRKVDHWSIIELLDLAFSKLPKEVVKAHCPPWTLEPSPPFFSSINMRWRTLKRKTINDRSVVYSSRRPTVEIQGGHWVMGWTKHAIDRLFDRCVQGRHNYGAISDVVATIDDVGRDTESDLRSSRGDRCVDIWFEPTENSISELVLLAVFNGLKPEGYHVVGCTCPIDFQGKFALCLTALAPSMLVYPQKDPRSQLLNWGTMYDTFDADRERWVEQIRELHAKKPLVRRFGTTSFAAVRR